MIDIVGKVTHRTDNTCTDKMASLWELGREKKIPNTKENKLHIKQKNTSSSKVSISGIVNILLGFFYLETDCSTRGISKVTWPGKESRSGLGLTTVVHVTELCDWALDWAWARLEEYLLLNMAPQPEAYYTWRILLILEQSGNVN